MMPLYSEVEVGWGIGIRRRFCTLQRAWQADPYNTSHRILGRNPLAVMAGCHFLNPSLVGQIPLPGLADPGFKSLLRLPAQFALDLARIHGVAPVVARTVFDIPNQLAVRDNRVGGPQLVENRTDGMYDLKVRLLPSSTP